MLLLWSFLAGLLRQLFCFLMCSDFSYCVSWTILAAVVCSRKSGFVFQEGLVVWIPMVNAIAKASCGGWHGSPSLTNAMPSKNVSIIGLCVVCGDGLWNDWNLAWRRDLVGPKVSSLGWSFSLALLILPFYKNLIRFAGTWFIMKCSRWNRHIMLLFGWKVLT